MLMVKGVQSKVKGVHKLQFNFPKKKCLLSQIFQDSGKAIKIPTTPKIFIRITAADSPSLLRDTSQKILIDHQKKATS
jgi:hypothetical protein